MLSECANSNCGKRLTSLSEGRVFQFEIVSISVSATDEGKTEEAFDETPERETASFWLCGQCAATMTLTLEPKLGLQLIPLESVAPESKNPRPIPREFHDC
jgi:hypothetical protein